MKTKPTSPTDLNLTVGLLIPTIIIVICALITATTASLVVAMLIARREASEGR